MDQSRPTLPRPARGERRLDDRAVPADGAGSFPLTRQPRCARLPTSPRKRGEVIIGAVNCHRLSGGDHTR